MTSKVPSPDQADKPKLTLTEQSLIGINGMLTGRYFPSSDRQIIDLSIKYLTQNSKGCEEFIQKELSKLIVGLQTYGVDEADIPNILKLIQSKLILAQGFISLQTLVSSISTTNFAKSLNPQFTGTLATSVIAISKYIENTESKVMEEKQSIYNLICLIKGLRRIIEKQDPREIMKVEKFIRSLSGDFETIINQSNINEANDLILYGFKEIVYDDLDNCFAAIQVEGKNVSVLDWGINQIGTEIQLLKNTLKNNYNLSEHLTLARQCIFNINYDISRYLNKQDIYGNADLNDQDRFNILLNLSISWLKAIRDLDLSGISPDAISKEFIFAVTEQIAKQNKEKLKDSFEDFFEPEAVTVKTEVVNGSAEGYTSANDFFDYDYGFSDDPWADTVADGDGDVVAGKTYVGDKVNNKVNGDFRGENINNFVNRDNRGTQNSGNRDGKGAKQTVQTGKNTVYQYGGSGQNISGDKVMGKTYAVQFVRPNENISFVNQFDKNTRIANKDDDKSNPYRFKKGETNILKGDIGYIEGDSKDIFEVVAPDKVTIRRIAGGELTIKAGAEVSIETFDGGNIYIEKGAKYYIKYYNFYGNNRIYIQS